MFTEEEKIRAIELYFKYGKKLAPAAIRASAIAECACPSRVSLTRIYRASGM